jgi:uncharacterized protein (TIGR02246 family)
MDDHALGDEAGPAVRALYAALLDAWNDRDAGAMARLYAEDGIQVGFDGSTLRGPAEIEAHLRPIFADHPTAAFVGIVKAVVPLGAGAAMLQAVAGMVPPGAADINPATNAVQGLVARRENGGWRVCLFQNTPAAFHGRTEDSERLAREIREAFRARGAGAA